MGFEEYTQTVCMLASSGRTAPTLFLVRHPLVALAEVASARSMVPWGLRNTRRQRLLLNAKPVFHGTGMLPRSELTWVPRMQLLVLLLPLLPPLLLLLPLLRLLLLPF